MGAEVMATMEATINNLRHLSNDDFEMISSLIERLGNPSYVNASSEQVDRALEESIAQYADTYRVLAQ